MIFAMMEQRWPSLPGVLFDLLLIDDDKEDEKDADLEMNIV